MWPSVAKGTVHKCLCSGAPGGKTIPDEPQIINECHKVWDTKGLKQRSEIRGKKMLSCWVWRWQKGLHAKGRMSLWIPENASKRLSRRASRRIHSCQCSTLVATQRNQKMDFWPPETTRALPGHFNSFLLWWMLVSSCQSCKCQNFRSTGLWMLCFSQLQQGTKSMQKGKESLLCCLHFFGRNIMTQSFLKSLILTQLPESLFTATAFSGIGNERQDYNNFSIDMLSWVSRKLERFCSTIILMPPNKHYPLYFLWLFEVSY